MKFVSERDTNEMLNVCGVKKIDELFIGIEPKLTRQLNLSHSMDELTLKRYMTDLSKKNNHLKCFIGGGVYDHYIPSAVNHIISRSEFYTAYTPYQAEVSQGTLQAIYEFQTYMCLLTGMDVANASMYDGATALSEGAFLACDATDRNEVAVLNKINPNYFRVLKTYCKAHGVTLTDTLSDKSACAIVQNPDYEGSVNNINEYAELTHRFGALLVVCITDPTSLAIIEPPGNCDADIALGDAQSFGNPISFGGPLLGFISVKKDLMKKIPGRLAGMTTDINGKKGFVLTLQAREQHIRRERASSNICSNEALCALAATVYLSFMGKKGLQNAAKLSYARAHLLQQKLCQIGFTLENNKPFYNEFTVKCPKEPGEIITALSKKGIGAGIDLGNQKMLICCTEKIREQDIDEYIDALRCIL